MNALEINSIDSSSTLQFHRETDAGLTKLKRELENYLQCDDGMAYSRVRSCVFKTNVLFQKSYNT